ncbi:hypothetical protein BHE74_00059787 [Ensete ventricosum]|nr:hypothetical protein BHE74_00059787 [Ensete ventricosum]
MLPLRFPNSDIRSKQTHRGGGWVANHSHASCRDDWPWPGHLQGGSRLWPRPHAKGRLAAAKAPCTRGGRLWPARKWLLACGEAIGAVPTRRVATPTACVGAAAAVQRGKRT